MWCSINKRALVASNLACGKARRGSIPRSGAVTGEQRSQRPNLAQPIGWRFFRTQASLIAPHPAAGRDGYCSSFAPRLRPKTLAANAHLLIEHHTRLLVIRSPAAGRTHDASAIHALPWRTPGRRRPAVRRRAPGLRHAGEKPKPARPAVPNCAKAKTPRVAAPVFC